MPRLFFRFPAKEQHQQPLTPSPPILPPKPAVERPGPQPSSQTASIRSRRITSPVPIAHAVPHLPSGGQQRGPTRLPHRVSASDSYAQGTAWRASSTAPPPESAPAQLAPRSGGFGLGSNASPPPDQPPLKPSRTAKSPLRPLRRSKGHQPIASERERRESEKAAGPGGAAASAVLQEETTQLKNEINQDTIRLTRIRQRQQAIREERERVEQEKRTRSQSREPPITPTTTSNASVNNRNMYNTSHNTNHANPYGKCQSTPVLPQSQPEWIPYGYNHAPRGVRSTAQSRESFQSTSSQDNNADFRRVRTPSASSNDRSPPPYYYHGTHTSYSPPNTSQQQQQHWQKVEQARRERERERAMAKLKETRELERKAFVDAWAVYESRWMLLTYATRSVTANGQGSAKALALSFFDIPWPLLHPPRGCDDITTAAIRRFIASEHQQEKDKTYRERIKEALLRWHPDRWSRILDHVRADHREEVRKGVDIVVRCLNELLHRQ